MPGAIFPTFWNEGRTKLITVDINLRLSKANIDLGTIEREYHDYKSTVSVVKLKKCYQDHLEEEAVAKEKRTIDKGELMMGIGLLTE